MELCGRHPIRSDRRRLHGQQHERQQAHDELTSPGAQSTVAPRRPLVSLVLCLLIIACTQTSASASVDPQSLSSSACQTTATTSSRMTSPSPTSRNIDSAKSSLSPLDRALASYVDQLFGDGDDADQYALIPGVEIARFGRHREGGDDGNSTAEGGRGHHCRTARNLDDDDAKVGTLEEYFYRKWSDYERDHALEVNIPATARFLYSTGKSSFMAGFGMGFLAFALKKLMLPLFIGAQLIKSVLIALFLPSILGSLGKIVGKGLSTFSGVSGSSAGLGGPHGGQQIEDFEFKDTGADLGATVQDYHAAESGLRINAVGADGMIVSSSTASPKLAMNRFGNIYGGNIHGNDIAYLNQQHPAAVPTSDSYYFRQPAAAADYKVFHKIPASSLLLTTYDPFYSPLLSRLDSVFQQLGLSADKSLPRTERCRERLICMMYANPAKYAPYSNLVSAQLSRELNELRKPSSDNPEILRFFNYMKAAKDGQDGEACLAYSGCPSLKLSSAGPAMITTYNDINKLVLARKLE